MDRTFLQPGNMAEKGYRGLKTRGVGVALKCFETYCSYFLAVKPYCVEILWSESRFLVQNEALQPLRAFKLYGVLVYG